MKVACPECQAHYEVDDSYVGTDVECPACKQVFTVAQPTQPVQSLQPVPPTQPAPQTQFAQQQSSGLNNAQPANISEKKGALYGCIVCLILAIIFNFISNLFFLIWIPLYLAAFVLAIVSIAQRRVAIGIVALLLSILAPLLIIAINTIIGTDKILDHWVEKRKQDTRDILERKNNPSSVKTSEQVNKPIPTAEDTSTEKTPNEKLGAFGLKLGITFDTQKAIHKAALTSGEPLYQVNPPKKFRKFQEYYVLITPSSNKIYSIWAMVDFNNKAASTEFDIVKGMLKKKYKIAPKDDIVFGGKGCTFEIDNSAIILKSDDKFTGKSSLEIRYTDFELSKLARDEKLEIEAAKSDSSAI